MQKAVKLEPGKFYHIYNRGNNKENIFVEHENYLYFLQKLKEYISPIACIYAYCLMPNHFHLLLQINDEKDLLGFWKPNRSENQAIDFITKISGHFSNMFNAYTKAFNVQYSRTGKLFHLPFKRIELTTEYYFTALIVYIHRNPVHHKFVDSIVNWPYSSYKAFLVNKTTLLPREKVLDWFGGTVSFLESHQYSTYEALEALLLE